ncbi:MAG: DUF1801 domain-containing protein [Lysobacterales bacterium]
MTAANSIEAYLSALPPDRREALSAVIDVVRANLDSAYEEGIQYGMIAWFVPHRVFAAGYHCDPKQPLPFVQLASQKNHMALYLCGLYFGPPEGDSGESAETHWFRKAWAASGKKLDMGKSCLRFKKLDNLALDVIGEAIRRVPAKLHMERYQQGLAQPRVR